MLGNAAIQSFIPWIYEFIKEGIVRKQSPDKSRAEFLNLEAEKSYNLLIKKIKLLPVDNESANDYVKSCYDIIMELIRAKMLLKGYYAIGASAHEAEVSFFSELGFKEKDVQFLDQIRYFRNGMLYYGKILDNEYALKVIEFTKRIYKELREKWKKPFQNQMLKNLCFQ